MENIRMQIARKLPNCHTNWPALLFGQPGERVEFAWYIRRAYRFFGPDKSLREGQQEQLPGGDPANCGGGGGWAPGVINALIAHTDTGTHIQWQPNEERPRPGGGTKKWRLQLLISFDASSCSRPKTA